MEIAYSDNICGNIHIFEEKTDKKLKFAGGHLDFPCASPSPWTCDLVRPDHDQNTSAHIHNICVHICSTSV